MKRRPGEIKTLNRKKREALDLGYDPKYWNKRTPMIMAGVWPPVRKRTEIKKIISSTRREVKKIINRDLIEADVPPYRPRNDAKWNCW